MGALLGAYLWQKMNTDRTSTTTEADSAHPLDCEDFLFLFKTTEMTATLDFIKSPDAILSVCCWSDEHWADPTASSEDVTINDKELSINNLSNLLV